MEDFNINVLDSTCPTTKCFGDVLRSFDLKWSINSPTRVTTTCETAIDNIITNIPDVAVSVVNTAISDHYGQEAIIRGVQPQNEPKAPIMKRNLSKTNVQNLNYFLARENWNFFRTEWNIESKFTCFQNIFNFHLNNTCPIKNIKTPFHKGKKTWITKGILISRDKLKLISELTKNSDSPVFLNYFKNYKKTYRKVIIAAKAYDISNSIINSKNVSKTAWEIINGRKNQKKNKPIKIEIEGEIISEASRVADVFNDFFCSVAIEQGLRPPHARDRSKQNSLTSMVLTPVSEEDVVRVIQQLPPKKSNDLHLNSPWLIKKCSRHIVSPLTQLINLSFQTGIFPSHLKVAKVTPIFKKGDPLSRSNYRPISIIPVFSKVFEKLFQAQLIQFLDKHNLLSNKQYGFRKGKSTTDAAVGLVDMVVEGLECRKLTQGVFLDLSKAFDCVDHKILLHKLEQHGIRGLPLSWLDSFLSNRYQIVQISDKMSTKKRLSYGVPQGSILSPLLFLIYVNNIHTSLQHGRLVQYADDTSLCFSSCSRERLEMQTYAELHSCVQMFHEINLNINTAKSKFINFSLRFSETEDGPAMMFCDTVLEEVYSTNFLGIYLDRGLTWEDHVDYVCAKISSGIFVLRTLSKYSPSQVLMTAYFGLIYPHLSYGVVLWGKCSKNTFSRVFRLQKQAIRIIAKLQNRESCKSSFQNLKLLTLPCIYILETILFCTSKSDLTRGRDVHSYETRNRDAYRTGRHRTVVGDRLPSQAGVRLYNSLPDSIKRATMPKALKAQLKRVLISKAFYSVDEFLTYHWETD